MTTDHSQWGEHQIIAALLAQIKNPDKWCVDVGAGDGVSLSNTRQLIDSGYRGVLIEADAAKFELLKANAADGVIPIKRYVMPEGDDSLDSILNQTAVPRDFDFLSIDIDGHDFHVWNELTGYHPKVVCIEFNPTMADDLYFMQPKGNYDTPYGSSLRAINRLAMSKGYRLVGLTVTNAIFAHDDYCSPDDRDLQRDIRFMSWTFYGYDGMPYTTGFCKSPWI